QRRRVVREHQPVVVARSPRQAVATDEKFDVVKRELRVARRKAGRTIIRVLEELRLEVEGEEVADLGTTLECQRAVRSPLECVSLIIDEGELAARVSEVRLSAIDGG